MGISLTRIYDPRPGWYRGDIHAHTTCSDGSLTPLELSRLADELRLDFLAITDHNDIRAFDDFDGSHPRLVLPGVEVTLREGHFNVFGFAGNTAEAQEIFRGIVDRPKKEKHLLSCAHSELEALMERISVAGYFISLNHPLLQPWEWRDAQTDIGWFEGIELVNDPTYGDNYRMNPLATRLWSAWLNAGYLSTGLGGSDFHSPIPTDNLRRLARLDLPLTYVYAEELSCLGILEGLRRRRVYISMGPTVELTLEAAGQTYRMGDDAGTLHSPGLLRLVVSGCQGNAQVVVVRNGKTLAKKAVQDGRVELEVEIPLGEAPVRAWYLGDVIDAGGTALAISNPIFLGPRRSPPPTSFGSLAGKLARS
jgi:hypothetical protein